ncbi:hypothetical protein GE061_003626 [Apolygus lucorum]|uniref:Uncharacterized protein n=1 Tax=Apolygus lucorum TaxID=248454 RepID=A0A8S9X4B2_APOLU|nr:hypothetical protein GE061_003626 [Apolygus lucorum]
MTGSNFLVSGSPRKPGNIIDLDSHSTMKLLWVAVVLTTFIKEHDFVTDYFAHFVKERNVDSLIAYIHYLAPSYMKTAEAVLEFCENAFPYKPGEFDDMRSIFDNVQQLISTQGERTFEGIIQLPIKDRNAKISKEEVEIWKRIDEKGKDVIKASSDFRTSTFSTTHIPFPLFLVTRDESELKKCIVDRSISEGYNNMRIFLDYMLQVLAEISLSHEVLFTYLEKTVSTDFDTDDGQQAYDNSNHYVSKLMSKRTSFQRLKIVYLNEFSGGRIDHMVFKKGSLPPYEALKTLVVRLMLFNNELDSHSTMKLLWVAVVLTTFIKEHDFITDYFAHFVKERNVDSLIAYIHYLAPSYMKTAEAVLEFSENAFPYKPGEFDDMRSIFDNVQQLISTQGERTFEGIIQLPIKDRNAKISKEEVEIWKRIDEKGKDVIKASSDFRTSTFSTTHIPFPLFLVTRDKSELSKCIVDRSISEGYNNMRIFLDYMLQVLAEISLSHEVLFTYLEKTVKKKGRKNSNHYVSKLMSKRTSFERLKIVYLNEFSGGRIDHMVFKKGSLPPYEALKTLVVRLMLFNNELFSFLQKMDHFHRLARRNKSRLAYKRGRPPVLFREGFLRPRVPYDRVHVPPVRTPSL